eukprot:6410291-Prymnesium_polylepis.1
MGLLSNARTWAAGMWAVPVRAPRYMQIHARASTRLTRRASPRGQRPRRRRAAAPRQRPSRRAVGRHPSRARARRAFGSRSQSAAAPWSGGARPSAATCRAP